MIDQEDFRRLELSGVGIKSTCRRCGYSFLSAMDDLLAVRESLHKNNCPKPVPSDSVKRD